MTATITSFDKPTARDLGAGSDVAQADAFLELAETRSYARAQAESTLGSLHEQIEKVEAALESLKDPATPAAAPDR